MVFENRSQAGKELARHFTNLKDKNPIVLGIPRGGVEVAAQIAKLIKAPLNVIMVRKIGHPFEKELAIGALAEGEVKVFDRGSINRWGISKKEIAKTIKQEKEELKRRIKTYRRSQKLAPLTNQTVILVDDGVATGLTVKAAILSIKKLNPEKIIFATPVCSTEAAAELKKLVDDFICLIEPFELSSIGSFYQDFSPVSDEQVLKLLKLPRSQTH